MCLGWVPWPTPRLHGALQMKGKSPPAEAELIGTPLLFSKREAPTPLWFWETDIEKLLREAMKATAKANKEENQRRDFLALRTKIAWRLIVDYVRARIQSRRGPLNVSDDRNPEALIDQYVGPQPNIGDLVEALRDSAHNDIPPPADGLLILSRLLDDPERIGELFSLDKRLRSAALREEVKRSHELIEVIYARCDQVARDRGRPPKRGDLKIAMGFVSSQLGKKDIATQLKRAKQKIRQAQTPFQDRVGRLADVAWRERISRETGQE